MKVKLNIDETWEASFSTKLEQDGPWSAWDLYKLAYEIEDQTLISEFEGLQSPKHLADLTPLSSARSSQTSSGNNEWESHFSR